MNCGVETRNYFIRVWELHQQVIQFCKSDEYDGQIGSAGGEEYTE